jgi:hypothetical protein
VQASVAVPGSPRGTAQLRRVFLQLKHTLQSKGPAVQTSRTLQHSQNRLLAHTASVQCVSDYKVINRDFLWRLIARGAAGICADMQCGIDIIIPFLYRDNILKKENISAFIIQSKNNERFKAKPHTFLFDMMCPYHIQFFDDKESNPVPII